MTDFADSEKRLIAALDRIDWFLDRAAGNSAAGEGQEDSGQSQALRQSLAELEAENATLRRQLDELRAERGDAAPATEAPGETEQALRAELAALKAQREAEAKALDQVLKGIERFVADAPRASDAPFAEDVPQGRDPGDVVRFGGQED